MDTLILEAGGTRATIAPHGAELRALRLAGRNLLWRSDPAVWDGVSPVLFPAIAGSRNDSITANGARYPMPLHGFAMRSRFDVIASDAASCTLRLTDSAETRAHYPFRFELSLRYSLEADALTIDARIANPGAEPLPAVLGLHPGFRWPLEDGAPKGDYSITLADDDAVATTRPINRLITPERTILPLPDGRLPLAETLFETGGLLILSRNSKRVVYGRKGGLAITIDCADFPQLLLWMKPGSPFLCIEPCRGHADPVDFDGEFRDKPGVSIIAPGGALDLSVRIGVTTLA